MNLLHRRPRIAEIAARAGVSTATVDRVINGRAGVRSVTVGRVNAAIREIHDRPPAIGPAVTGRIDVVLADDGSPVTHDLGAALVGCGRRAGIAVEVAFAEPMNPAELAARLHACAEQGSLGVAVQALDHVLVRAALDRLGAARVPIVAVLTNIPSTNVLAYIGLDNRAAGRTAGLLMGRFCRRPGTLAIVWGGELYRSHEERESGFRNILRFERPDLRCLEVITGNDDPAVARDRLGEVLAAQRDIAGIYCVGGGITGVVAAVEAAGLEGSLVVIGHNYNSQTAPALLCGTIDAVIHQDTARIAERAFAALMTRTPPPPDSGIAIEIVTRENNAYR